LTQIAVAASASARPREILMRHAKLAPSPPNTNGNSRPASALVTAAITEAPAMLTLVTRFRDRPGRFHDIGNADAPVIRQTAKYSAGSIRREKPRKDRNLAVEGVVGVVHGRVTAGFEIV